MSRVQILQGHCLDMLRSLPEDSVDCVITSPPFWSLRDYGLPPSIWGGNDPDCEHEWETRRYYREGGGSGGSHEAFSQPGPENAARIKKARWRETSECVHCAAWRGQLGLEPTIHQHVANLVEVFREVRRVLKVTGTLWLNYGDMYESGTRSSRDYSKTTKHGYWNNPNIQFRVSAGLRPKNLIGMPWRVAFALQDDGWILRSDIVWHKPGPMPESVTDRPTRAHEYIFLFSLATRYYYDHEAIKEPCVSDHGSGNGFKRSQRLSYVDQNGARGNDQPWRPGGKKNKRSVWTVATQAFREAHFATFPTKLIEPCVKAGCPEGGVILDPFAGSGTVGVVASRFGRNAILIEQNPEYCDMIRRRNAQEALLL
jgi:DNA modification methylase